MLSDLGSSLRQLRREPGFAATVVVLLGAGLGLLLTVTSAVSALLWQPLPYADDDRLVSVRAYARQMGMELGYSDALVEAMRATPGVEALGRYQHSKPLALAGGELSHARLSLPLVQMLGARPLLGRLLDAGDVDAVLLSEPVWRSRFGADPAVVGRELPFDDRPRRVVGVVADPFGFPQRSTASWSLLPDGSRQMIEDDGSVPLTNARVLLRRAPETRVAALQQAIDAIAAQDEELQMLQRFMGLEMQVRPLREQWVADKRPMLMLLAAAAAMLLLLLMTNVAALWLARGLRRSRDLALRAALGAGRRRLLRAFGVELLWLFGAGAVLGLLLVPPGVRGLQWLGVLSAEHPLLPQVDLPTALLALALPALAMLTMLLSQQAWLLRRLPATQLAHAGDGVGPAHGRMRLQRVLVAVQLALAVALLAAGGLLLRSFDRLLSQDIGFRPQSVLALSLDGSNAASQAALVDALGSVPGVLQVSFADAAPFTDHHSVGTTRIAGEEAEIEVRRNEVGAAYFGVLQQPLLRGRGFDDGLHDGVVIDALFAERYFPDRDPLQQSLIEPVEGSDEWRPLPIVGIVAATHQRSLEDGPDQPAVYRLAAAPDGKRFKLLLRSEVAPSALRPALVALIESHGLRLENLISLDQQVRDSVAHRVPLLILLATFAAGGVLLAAVGLFALIAGSVQGRLGEFGLRLALGATPAGIRRLALRGGLAIAMPGLVLGMAAALALGQALSAQLFQVSPWDPATLLVVSAAAVVVTLLACTVPARRAARVDPVVMLRRD